MTDKTEQIEEEIEEILKEEILKEYDPSAEKGKFYLDFDSIRNLVLEHDSLRDKKNIGKVEVYDVSYICIYPDEFSKTLEIGVKSPINMHTDLWERILKACEVLEFVRKEELYNKNEYFMRIHFSVPTDDEKRKQLFSGLKMVRSTIDYIANNTYLILDIGYSIKNLDSF